MRSKTGWGPVAAKVVAAGMGSLWAFYTYQFLVQERVFYNRKLEHDDLAARVRASRPSAKDIEERQLKERGISRSQQRGHSRVLMGTGEFERNDDFCDVK